MPAISIIMTTFNEKPELLRVSIESILNQTFDDYEFIVVVESGEKNRGLLEALSSSDRRLRIIESSENGFVACLNLGLRSATSELVARMDSDDISMPDRLMSQYRYLMENNGVDVLGGTIDIINPVGEKIGRRQYPIDHQSIVKKFAFSSAIAHPTVMFRRKILKGGEGYDLNFPKSEDLELWLRMIRKGCKFGNLADVLVAYRVPEGNCEKRPRLHWRCVVRARWMHGNIIWGLGTVGAGILVFSVLSVLPTFIYRIIVGTERSKRIKGYSS